ncbi:MAG TPA: hypothetical protein VI958_08995 [Acidobacteriota bacterium]
MIQVIVKIEALEEAFTHISRQVRLFDGGMYKINCPPGGVQYDAAVITSSQMLFDLLAKFRIEFTVNILGQRSQ